jgi:CheY-like chemotaxis protein
MEAVGRLAGGVAHDFNNMLQAILGHAELALIEAPAGSRLRESLMEIQIAGQRSADLTHQLLAFARKQTVSPKVLDLNDTVSGMLKMLHRLIGENIQLLWIPGAGLWSIKMDPSQIDQILANLTVNARDAIANVGKVTIETANVTFDDTYVRRRPECVPGDYVMLAISDTGRGMNEDTQARIFEPFFTTKEFGKGTGLGLAIVFGIVKQNKGFIYAYSEPGQGTTFKLYFPRAEEEAKEAKQPAALRSLRGKETVLLVEDEEQILNIGRLILEEHGYTVLTACTPAAAITLTLEHRQPIHLLITDVVMPGMNGQELKQQLIQSYPDLKCLFVSGYTANAIAHSGVLDDDVHFLQKPFTIRTLAEKVREVLET